jgi:hypothetical protein
VRSLTDVDAAKRRLLAPLSFSRFSEPGSA